MVGSWDLNPFLPGHSRERQPPPRQARLNTIIYQLPEGILEVVDGEVLVYHFDLAGNLLPVEHHYDHE